MANPQQQQSILWQPNPGPQTLALQCDPNEFYEIGYGGRRGGGKTAGGIGWLLYDVAHPKLRALIVRKRAEDLKDWIDRARQVYEPLGAVFKGNPPEIHWPSGAIFRTGHLNDANAYAKYVGHEYHRELIEELNLISSKENYLKLISSCRSTIPELPPQVMSNFNPSDVGFFWIKEHFGLHGIPQKAVITTDKSTGLKRIFIPAGLKDNPYLDRNPQYNSFLNSLPDGLREAWRDGSWDDPIIRGAYYTLEISQAQREERIRFFPHDPYLKVHTVWDIGIDDATAIGFFQRTKNEMRLVDYYQNDSYGLDHYSATLSDWARTKRYSYGKHFSPHDAGKREFGTGQTIIQTAKKLGITFSPVPMVPINDGIMKLRLMFPHLYISVPKAQLALDGMRNYRREWDEELLKYNDRPLHDWSSHPADMMRYAALVESQMTNDNEGNYESEAPNLDPYQQ